MSRYYNSGILGDIPCGFLCSLLYNKASKSPQVNVVTIYHGMLYRIHKGLNSLLNCHLLNTSVLGNFINDVCFSHFREV